MVGRILAGLGALALAGSFARLMELSDVENLILTGCAVVTLLGAGGGALLRVCRRFDRVEEQNALQSQQLATLTVAVDRLQAWALGRAGQGEGH